jgi:hypothetical protein
MYYPYGGYILVINIDSFYVFFHTLCVALLYLNKNSKIQNDIDKGGKTAEYIDNRLDLSGLLREKSNSLDG